MLLFQAKLCRVWTQVRGGLKVPAEGERTDRSGAFIFVTIQNFPSKRS